MLRDSKLSPTFAALAIQFAKSFGFDSRLFCVRFLLFYFYKYVVYHYFNFIKKQLSRLFGLHAESLRKFQFHKGTIITLIHFIFSALQQDFNSIKVQLKHLMRSASTASDSNFNSIKVQLKPARADCRDCVIRHFNSIKVQLKRHSRCLSQCAVAISIP